VKSYLQEEEKHERGGGGGNRGGLPPHLPGGRISPQNNVDDDYSIQKQQQQHLQKEKRFDLGDEHPTGFTSGGFGQLAGSSQLVMKASYDGLREKEELGEGGFNVDSSHSFYNTSSSTANATHATTAAEAAINTTAGRWGALLPPPRSTVGGGGVLSRSRSLSPRATPTPSRPATAEGRGAYHHHASLGILPNILIPASARGEGSMVSRPGTGGNAQNNFNKFDDETAPSTRSSRPATGGGGKRQPRLAYSVPAAMDPSKLFISPTPLSRALSPRPRG